MNYRFLGKPPANIEHWMKTHEPTPPTPPVQVQFSDYYWGTSDTYTPNQTDRYRWTGTEYQSNAITTRRAPKLSWDDSLKKWKYTSYDYAYQPIVTYIDGKNTATHLTAVLSDNSTLELFRHPRIMSTNGVWHLDSASLYIDYSQTETTKEWKWQDDNSILKWSDNKWTFTSDYSNEDSLYGCTAIQTDPNARELTVTDKNGNLVHGKLYNSITDIPTTCDKGIWHLTIKNSRSTVTYDLPYCKDTSTKEYEHRYMFIDPATESYIKFFISEHDAYSTAAYVRTYGTLATGSEVYIYTVRNESAKYNTVMYLYTSNYTISATWTPN